MHPSEKWFDLVYEDYCTYLETVHEDVCPMSYESFEWLKLREFQEDQVI
jgi:hypothetical protein